MESGEEKCFISPLPLLFPASCLAFLSALDLMELKSLVSCAKPKLVNFVCYLSRQLLVRT